VPRADKAYGMEAHGVQRQYACADAGRLAADLRSYLRKVVARPQFVRGEGRCHAWLSRHFGQAHNVTGWVTVDSESVFGFADAVEKASFWSPIRAMERETRAILTTDPARFAKDISSDSFGDEVDLLLWDPRAGEFIVTEVKDGGSPSGVYLSPLQVSCYVVAWRRFAAFAPQVALSGLRELVLQRQRLGLISGDCRPPETTADLRFRPVIVVQAPNERSACWEKLTAVRRAVERAWQQTDMCRATVELLTGLSVLSLRDNQLDDITLACADWRRRGHQQQA
jgi:hypothetical protein